MKYSTIYWSYSHGLRDYPGNTTITYSELEHRAAMRRIRDHGGFIHYWQ